MRADNLGDVLLAGPAVRAVASSGARVVMAVSPRGRPAAERLPGIGHVVEVELPWISADPVPYDEAQHERLVESLRAVRADEALVLTSYHQSALPTALLLRLAGVPWITAISEDYPGSLLDVRVPPPPPMHEVERMLAVAAAAGYVLEEGDDRSLHIAGAPTPGDWSEVGPYVVVHPGCSVPARTLDPDRWAAIVAELGRRTAVVVTGSVAERRLVDRVLAHQPDGVRAAITSRFDDLACVLAGASAVVVGNTGPAHLAAALGVPVVSIFAPTVDPDAWRPWGVPHRLLGRLDIACAGCRSRVCPLDEQACLAAVRPGDVVAAVAELAGVLR